MRPGILRSKLDITAKVYLYLVIALLCAFLISAVLIWNRVDELASAHLQEGITENGITFQQYYRREIRALTALGNWLGMQRRLVELIKSRDGAALAGYLLPWLQSTVVDSIGIVDRDGTVLLRMAEDQPFGQGDDWQDQAGIKEALRGGRSDGLEQDSHGRLQGRVILPIYEDEQYPPIGVLILGFYLDGSFLQDLVRSTTTDIIVVYKDRIAAASLTEIQGKLSVGQQAPATILAAEKENRPTDFLDIQTDIGTYRFKFYPLPSPTHVTVGMFGFGVPLTSLNTERDATLKAFGIGLVAGLIVIGIVGLLLARSLVIPVRELTAAAQAMSGGNLSTTIQLKRNDELGDLARQMENMREQLDQALRSSLLDKRRYELVIESMGVPVVVTDQDYCLMAVNASAEVLFRKNKASLLGQSWNELFAVSESGQDQTLARSGVMGASPDATLTLRRRFPLRARPQAVLNIISTQVQVDGKTSGYVHILEDVSPIEAFARAKDEFLLNVAHELLGPLASWRTSLDLLLEDYATFNKRDLRVMLRSLQKTVLKFQGLVENLVDIGRVQAGRFTVHPVPTRFNRILKDGVSQIEFLLKAKGQQLEVKDLCPPNCIVLADRARIIQVLVNLLLNASKYSPENHPIVLSTCRDWGYVFVGVTDHGAGIPPEDQAQLFQRFFRGKLVEEEGAGLGLGLALVKSIVEGHGGQIGVNSRVGEGATFWFSIPEQQEPVL